MKLFVLQGVLTLQRKDTLAQDEDALHHLSA